MNMTEREKDFIKKALDQKWVSEDDLIDMGYAPKEINEVKTNRHWILINYNIDFDSYSKSLGYIKNALGPCWDMNYDYKVKKEKEKYELYLFITDEEFDRICKEHEKDEKGEQT